MGEPIVVDTAIARMPRGGPDASWLDRRLQTNTLEYTDRYDVPDEVKQAVVSALDRMGARFGAHEKSARIAVELVAAHSHPRILELGAGHGRLSEQILRLHPDAMVTISDLDPTSVANIAGSVLGADPRVQTRVVDATAIDAEDATYDLVVFAQSFHHLPPAAAARAIAEGTRVGRQFLVIDLKRLSALKLIATGILVLPMAAVMTLMHRSLKGLVHDGYISMLRAYSRTAMIALGHAVDPTIGIDFLSSPFRSRPDSEVTVFSRHCDSIDAGRGFSGGVEGTLSRVRAGQGIQHLQYRK